MINVIILNGPPGSGKDSIANEITKMVFGSAHVSFKEFLILESLPVGMSIGRWNDNYTREKKELPFDLLPINKKTGEHYTPRDWLIHRSEEVTKPKYGNDYFGKLAYENVYDINKYKGFDSFIFSDGGFIEEIEVFADKHRRGELNLHVVNLIRKGCTFHGDSRDYVEVEGVNQFTIFNNDTLASACLKIIDKVGL